jgi:F-type H+-transporting ATPase subunit delta
MSSRDRVRDYANAFYEAAWERWLGALEAVHNQVEQRPELLARLEAANVDFTQRQRMLDGLLPAGADQPVRNLLYALMQRNDLSMLGGILAALRERMRQTGAGPVEVEIVSAVPLSDDQRQALLAKLQEQNGTALDVRYRVDPAILGGLIVRVGDQLIDNSVATRLAGIRQALGVTVAS